jgi:hypothetical protein
MSRTIVLRVSQRANSHRISLSVALEIDGHLIQIPSAHASATNNIGCVLDEIAARRVLAAARSDVRNWVVAPTLWGDR